MRINLGSGCRPKDGFVNVDIAAIPEVDVVCDLDTKPWPFEDSSAELITAEDVFEHVAKPLVFMQECGRILASGGELHIRTNYWQEEIAFTDPTHVRFCTHRTFDYWIADTEFYARYGAIYSPGFSFYQVENKVDHDRQLVVCLVKMPLCLARR